MQTRSFSRVLAPLGALVALVALTGATATRCEPLPEQPLCVERGEHVFPWDPNGLACCEGLVATVIAELDETVGACAVTDGALVCLPCGDGVCDEDENLCSCPDDCEDEACLEAGEYTYPWDENDPGCCAGLMAIGVADYDPATGLCEPLIGGAICAPCGDGVCDEMETPCTCPSDC